jgi:hypothetical protein
MKSSDPMYGRPGWVGSGGSGANHASGRSERSAGVGTGVELTDPETDGGSDWLDDGEDEAGVQADATSARRAGHTASERRPITTRPS